MSHQFELFPPPPPRKEPRLRSLSLYYPWLQICVLYKLDEKGLRVFRVFGPVVPVKVGKAAGKRRWSASELRLHGAPE